MNRTGFTVIELLTAIAIIGVLASLLLPAIQQAREAGRRAQCASQLRQQALALTMFHDVNRRYPSAHQIGMTWYSSFERETPPGGFSDDPQFPDYPYEGPFWSWMLRIAPYIEMENLYNAADKRGHIDAWPWWQKLPDGTYLNGIVCPLFLCPSDARGFNLRWYRNRHYASLSTYLGVSGRNQFVEAGGQDGMLYVNSSVRMTSVTDGLSNTLLIGERPPSNNLLYGWQWAGAGDRPSFGATDVVLGVHERFYEPDSPPDFFRPGKIQDPKDLHRYHFWSLHPGGGMWAFCDQSVRFFAYEAGGPQAELPGDNVSAIEAMATRSSGDRADHDEWD
jgi:prepilin-type N-terminal cleavage/methylation domain-containing protein